MTLDGCTALITGASSGLGAEFARQISLRAKAVVLVARRRERLEELRDALQKQHANLRVEIRPTDLAQPEEIEALCGWLEEAGLAIDLLVNNAGLGDYGLFAKGEPEKINGMLQVNVVALTLLTRRLLPAMLAAKRGGILNVSSSASFLPMKNLGVYAASKAYVTSFSEALRMETRGTGVTVSALCPGPVPTEFQNVAARSNERKELGPSFIHVSPATAVHTGLRAIEADRALVIPGLLMRIAMLLVRMTPAPVLRLASGITR